MATQAVAKGDGPLAFIQNKQKAAGQAIQTWMKRQPPYVEVAVATLGGATQGGVLGGVMGSMSKMSPPNPNLAAGAAGPKAGMSTMMGGPGVQARNFAVMTGVHACISTTLKKVRNGTEDLKGNMVASFGSGAAFSLVSGVGGPNPIPNALSTGVVFALFQGAFYQIGKQFSKGKAGGSGAKADAAYFRTDQMLDTLGLVQYRKNFRRGLLSDSTLPLLTDSALHDARVPAGPRLLILDHVNTYKNYYKQDLAKRAQLLPKDQ